VLKYTHTQCVMNCLLHGTLFRLTVQKFTGLSVEAQCSKKEQNNVRKVMFDYVQQNLMNSDLD